MHFPHRICEGNWVGMKSHQPKTNLGYHYFLGDDFMAV